MASQIALSVFCLAFVACIQATPLIKTLKEGTHDIYQCADPGTNAKTSLFDKTIEVAASFLAVHKETVNFPESGVNKHIISCIIVENELGEDGGYAILEPNTGVGYNTAKVELESQRSKAMKFRIQIYTAENL